jgi:hypothetical protein
LIHNDFARNDGMPQGPKSKYKANCGVIQNYGPDGGQATESKNLTEVGYKPAVVFGGELWCASKSGARQPKAKI